MLLKIFRFVAVVCLVVIYGLAVAEVLYHGLQHPATILLTLTAGIVGTYLTRKYT